MNTKEIQQALHAKGFDPGIADGVRGRRTIAAIRAFQEASGLVVDGIVGPVTAAALFGSAAKVPKTKPPISVGTPWYSEAWASLDIREDTSDASNKILLLWAKNLKIPYGNDEIPWCGLFVAHCIGSQLPTEPLPNNPLGARNWGAFGNECTPQPGAVMVFWRESKTGGKGHVGLYAGEDKKAFHILGGNQSDKVCVSKVGKDRFLHARWPSTVPAPTGKAFLVSEDGKPLSKNEQ